MGKDAATRSSALIVAMAGSFITPFMGSSINVALPEIGRTFAVDAVLLSWIATVYLLAAGIALLPAGRAADIAGRKRVLAWGFALFSLSSVFCGLSASASTLILARMFQGIGSGMIFATGAAILVSVFPPAERGRVLGITVGMVYVGLLSGPFVGGALTQHLTWRSLFLLNAFLGTLVLCLIRWKLKGEWADAAGERLDVTGAVIYGGTLVAVIYGLSLVPSWQGLGLLFLGLGGLATFVWWEKRTADPLFDLELLTRNRTFALSNLAALIHYSATFAVTFLLSLYLQYVKGLGPQSAGLVLIAQPLTMALFSPFTGRLSDRIEPRIIATAGMMVMSGMLVTLSFIAEATGLAYIVASLLVLGFGYALFSSPNMNAIMGSVEKKQLGLASGSAATMRVMGQMFSMAVATLVLSLFVGRRPITESLHPDLLRSFRVTFLAFALLSLLGIVASSVRGNLRTQGGSSGEPASTPGV
jgi:EmrB/QacA subfamily drug resistance transporter